MVQRVPQPIEVAPASAHRRLDAPFGWFAGSLAVWSGAAGMQQVLFSWLVIGELRASAEWVGTAQMFQSLPAYSWLQNDPVDELRIRELVDAVGKKSAYRAMQIPEATLRDLAVKALERQPSTRMALKTVRRKLHQITAPYLGDPDYGNAIP